MPQIRCTALVLAALLAGTAPAPAQPRAARPPAAAEPTSAAVNDSIVVGGKSIRQWMQDLQNKDDASAREAAIKALSRYREGALRAGAVPILIRMVLYDPDASVRVNATAALAVTGLESPADPRIRVAAPETDNIGNGLQALIWALTRDSQEVVRMQAAQTLGVYAFHARYASPHLANVVKDKKLSWVVRKSAATALGTTGWTDDGRPATIAVDALTVALNDPAADVRLEAILSLFLLAPQTTRNDPLVHRINFMQRNEKDQRIRVWVAMMQIVIQHRPGQRPSEGHLQTIAAALGNSDPAVRLHAARALEALGTDAGKARVHVLIGALRDKEPGVVSWVIMALHRMGSLAAEALPDLEQIAKAGGPNRQVAQDAIEAIKGAPKSTPTNTEETDPGKARRRGR